MMEAELNRILSATKPEPAPCSSRTSRARLISHRPPTKSKKGQATTHNGVRPH
jgi:hypothetical protein